MPEDMGNEVDITDNWPTVFRKCDENFISVSCLSSLYKCIHDFRQNIKHMIEKFIAQNYSTCAVRHP